MSAFPVTIESGSGHVLRGTHREPTRLSDNSHNLALMIFCHGFPETPATGDDPFFKRLQNICASIGLHSISFDFGGCGESDGETEDFSISSSAKDMEAVLRWAKEHHFERYMITAEGLGVVPALLNLNESIAAMSFFWPVFDTHDFAVRNLQAEEHKEHFEEGGYIRINRINVGIPLIKELYEMDLVPVMNQVKMPCLIQQGAKDDIIPIDHLDLARAHFRNRRIELTTYQDGIHGLPRETHRKYAMFHYEQFVQKYI